MHRIISANDKESITQLEIRPMSGSSDMVLKTNKDVVAHIYDVGPAKNELLATEESSGVFTIE